MSLLYLKIWVLREWTTFSESKKCVVHICREAAEREARERALSNGNCRLRNRMKPCSHHTKPTKPNQTKPNQTNQTKPTKPHQPNQTKPNQKMFQNIQKKKKIRQIFLLYMKASLTRSEQTDSCRCEHFKTLRSYFFTHLWTENNRVYFRISYIL